MESGGTEMTGSNSMERFARLVVDSIRAVAGRRILVSCIGLVLTVAVAFAYISIGSLRANPMRTSYSVRVQLPESGGLLANQDVTIRGIPVGRVTSIELTDQGVEAVATIDGRTHIPADSPVRVSALSAAGEQYLDFRPGHDGGPFLTDGAVIGGEQASIPMTLPRIIDDSRGALAQLDAKKLAALVDELRVGRAGPQKLAAIFDGSIFLTSTLHGVLPQTVSLLRNSQVVLTTLGEITPGLRQTTANLQNTLGGVNKMDGGFRALIDQGSGQLADFDNFVADNRENIVQLLGNLTTLSQVMYLRVPALQNLWRPDHDALIDRLSSIAHDGALWGVVSLYPGYRCDYDVPRGPVPQPDFAEPYLNTYCNNPDPSVLIRGARNAPRPPGDDTAGPPPGQDRLAQTAPTPNYPPYTLPTPYGGPELPAWLPN